MFHKMFHALENLFDRMFVRYTRTHVRSNGCSGGNLRERRSPTGGYFPKELGCYGTNVIFIRGLILKNEVLFEVIF